MVHIDYTKGRYHGAGTYFYRESQFFYSAYAKRRQRALRERGWRRRRHYWTNPEIARLHHRLAHLQHQLQILDASLWYERFSLVYVYIPNQMHLRSLTFHVDYMKSILNVKCGEFITHNVSPCKPITHNEFLMSSSCKPIMYEMCGMWNTRISMASEHQNHQTSCHPLWVQMVLICLRGVKMKPLVLIVKKPRGVKMILIELRALLLLRGAVAELR